ncbi:MAG: hypothetical protein V1735_07515 [Nanoarchaeota archaeon]
MVYFTEIWPSEHYISDHECDVPWEKVVEIIFSTKNPRKKGDLFEIERDSYYVLFAIEGDCLIVINAKKT